MTVDPDDIRDFIDEHKASLIMGGLALLGIGNAVFGGGMDALSKSAEITGKATQAANSQKLAEQILETNRCTTQAHSVRTGSASFREGDIAVDPASVSPANPDGDPFPKGTFICATSGALFVVGDKGVLTLIASSPKIREKMVQVGVIKESSKMAEEAAKRQPRF